MERAAGPVLDGIGVFLAEGLDRNEVSVSVVKCR